MALTKVSGGILDPGIDVAGIVTATGFDGPFIGGSGKNIVAGIITCTELDLNGNGNISGNLVVEGNLTANGDFTTLNTTLREVEILRVDANTTAVAGIITQRGSGDILNLYDDSTEVFSVDASGRVKIGTTSNKPAAANEAGIVFGDNTAGTVKKGVASFCADGAAPLLLTRRVSDGNVLGIADDVGTKGLIRVNSNNLEITSIYALTLATGTGHNQKVRLTNDGKVGIGSMIPAAKLDVNGTSKFQDDVIAQKKISFADSPYIGSTIPPNSLRFGDNDDLILYHTGNYSGIDERGGGTGGLVLHCTNNFTVKGNASNKNRIIAKEGGAVELYYDNVKTAFTGQDQWIVHGRTANSGMVEIASNQGANNNDRFRIHKTSAASRLTIQNYSTGSWVENIRINAGGAVELKHADGTTKLETTSTGSKITGNLELSSTYPSLTWTDTNHNSDFRITNNDGTLIVYDITRGAHVLDFKPTGDLHIRNDKGLYFGESNDLLIAHDGSSTRINDNFGYLNITSNALDLRSTTGSELYANFIHNGSAKLYYDGTERFATSGIGVTVTGEVAASQDYPIPKPVLDFNFAAEKKLDPRIQFTRASIATFIDKKGIVQYASDNQPRFDHHPTSGVSLGLLLERQQTNFEAYSVLMSQANHKNNITVTDNFAISPDGTQNASKIVNATSNNAQTSIGWSANGVPSGQYVMWSVWVKSEETSCILQFYSNTYIFGNDRVNIELADGTHGGTTPSGTFRFNIEKYPNKWWRISVGGNGSGSAGGWYIGVVDSKTAARGATCGSATNKTWFAWGVQEEIGTESRIATSYIPTNGAAVTRVADRGTIDGDDFDDFFDRFQGTIINEHSNALQSYGGGGSGWEFNNDQLQVNLITQTGSGYAHASYPGCQASVFGDRNSGGSGGSGSPGTDYIQAYGPNDANALNQSANSGNGRFPSGSVADYTRYYKTWTDAMSYDVTPSENILRTATGGASSYVGGNTQSISLANVSKFELGSDATDLLYSNFYGRIKRWVYFDKVLPLSQLRNLTAQLPQSYL